MSDTSYFDATHNINCYEECGGTEGAFDIIKAIVVGIIAFLIVVGNSFCLLVLWRTKDIHDVARLFMASLTVADLAFGFLVVIPVAVSSAFNAWPLHHNSVCHYHEAVTFAMAGALNLCLFGIGVDRWIAVCKPLKYPSLVTRKRALFVILIFWALPVTYRLTSRLAIDVYQVQFRSDSDMCWVCTKQAGHSVYTAGVVIFMVIPFFITCCVYTQLFLIARRHAHRIAATVNNMAPSILQPDAWIHTKSAKTFLIITVTFGICWMPFMGTCVYREITGQPANSIFVVVVQMMAFSNSWLNCLVYYYRSTVFKRTAREIFRNLSVFKRSQGNAVINPNVRTIHIGEASETNSTLRL